jgi:YHS domain-containing protein
MTVRFVLFSALMTLGSSTAVAYAQASDNPQTPAATVVLPCVQAQAAAAQTVDAATARLETARQSNSGPAMRAAVDDLDRLLRDLRTQLAPCSAAMQAQAPASHAGHALPAAPASGATVPQAAAGAHAGHGAPAPPTGVAPQQAAPAAAPHQHAAPSPAALTPNRPARTEAPEADAHAGHAAESSAAAAPAAALPKAVTTIAALKCRAPVDPKTAPRMLHRGQMYYFCNEDERAAFAKEAATAPRAPAKSAPAHAH